MQNIVVTIHPSWKEHLLEEFQKPYMQDLSRFLKAEKTRGVRVYPPGPLIFSAFNHTPLHKVKVVILGQDPYHKEGQAHGMAFSVNHGVDIPPSLRNIFKELESDLAVRQPNHGNLTDWANQGVLLLNSSLSVEEGNAGSHAKKGWETFTDKVIALINQQCENVVFILWGSHAQNKGRMIDTDKHLILTSVHPSPLSSYRGFFGCRHFSQANDYLDKKGLSIINWAIDDYDLEPEHNEPQCP